MSEKRQFRFGGGLFWAASGADWADGARRLESAGFDTLLIGDHFSPNSLAPVPALLAAALATTRLRVGCTVFDNDFRHPAVASDCSRLLPDKPTLWASCRKRRLPATG